VAVGGRGTLYGAIAGAVLVNYAKTISLARFLKYGFMRSAPCSCCDVFLPRGLLALCSKTIGPWSWKKDRSQQEASISRT